MRESISIIPPSLSSSFFLTQACSGVWIFLLDRHTFCINFCFKVERYAAEIHFKPETVGHHLWMSLHRKYTHQQGMPGSKP